MRPTQLLLEAGFFILASAASDASVFSLGSSKHHTSRQDPLSVEPSAARLYLAQQLGLSKYHSLDGADSVTLELLNEGLNDQRPLFAERSGRDVKRVVLFLEGVDNPQDFLGISSDPLFKIADPPSPGLNSILAQDLQCQLKQMKGVPELCNTVESHLIPDSLDLSNSDSVIYISDFESSALTTEQYAMSMTSIKIEVAELHSSSNIETTVVCFPPATKVPRRGISDWGSYAKPSAEHSVRHAQNEAPLSDGDLVALDQPEASSAPVAPHFQNKTVPRTTISSCYSSKQGCVDATADCSGHGECFKKFTEKLDGNEEGAECWACKCRVTTLSRDVGSQRIFWGGPACQKKDISTPFFLLAGFTIAAVSIISWGIGLLYSVGSEQLPSVLSAGISGPIARK